MHEACKGRHKPGKSLLQARVLLAKLNASISIDQFVHLLKTVISLRAIKLAEQRFPCQIWCCIWQSADSVNFASMIICNQVVNFPEIHKETYFSVGFLLCKNGTRVIWEREKGRTVMIPYLCIRANSPITSAFRRMGIGRFWVKTALSSIAVSLTFNSLFSPMSILCLANLLWYSTRMFSTVCFFGFRKQCVWPIKSL